MVASKFRRAPDKSCSYFTVANVHINNECTEWGSVCNPVAHPRHVHEARRCLDWRFQQGVSNVKRQMRFWCSPAAVAAVAVLPVKSGPGNEGGQLFTLACAGLLRRDRQRTGPESDKNEWLHSTRWFLRTRREEDHPRPPSGAGGFARSRR